MSWARLLPPLVIRRILLILLVGILLPPAVMVWVDQQAPRVTLRAGGAAPSSVLTMEDPWTTRDSTGAWLAADPSLRLAAAVLGIPAIDVRIVHHWPWVARLYLGRLMHEADGITLPVTGTIYLRGPMLWAYDPNLVRGVMLHELVHHVDTRSGGRLAAAWEAARVPPVRDPGQYGFRNVYEQRAEAGEAALLALLALERGGPPEQTRRYLESREASVPGTILMFRWLLSSPALADRAWRQVTFFADVGAVPAPWAASIPRR